MTDSKYTDETLNAFLDGELDLHDSVDILTASEERDDVRTRLCELRYMKELVAHAYSDVPHPGTSSASGSRESNRVRQWATAAAMVAVMAVGIGIGWVSNEGNEIAEAVPDDPVFLDINDMFSLQEAKAARGHTPSSIILHVTTNDRYRIEDALAKLEEFVGEQRQGNNKVSVEIVANGYGLDLIRTAQMPYEDKLKNLAGDDYVTILACRLAVQRLIDRGVDVDLIPEAEFARSALDRIIDRLRDGWVYVKV